MCATGIPEMAQHDDQNCPDCRWFSTPFDPQTGFGPYLFSARCDEYAPSGSCNYSAPPECFCAGSAGPSACRERRKCQTECKKRGISYPPREKFSTEFYTSFDLRPAAPAETRKK